jgi:hypothetical protein
MHFLRVHGVGGNRIGNHPRPFLAIADTGQTTPTGHAPRCPALKRNEDAMTPEALPGYVWLDSKPRRVHVWAGHLEFRDTPP